VDATCTHYSGPLGDGLVVDDTVRCPWHHACFSLRTGEALGPPALSALGCWQVEQRAGKVFVTGKKDAPAPKKAGAGANAPKRIVIVGGGAAGFAAAEKLRREGFDGDIPILGGRAGAPG